jgi:hypothetical protein
MMNLMSLEFFQKMMAKCPGEPYGAYPKGARVVKIHGEAYDMHPLGTTGTVRGSVCHPETSEIAYMIEWDHRVHGFIIAKKIERLA